MSPEEIEALMRGAQSGDEVVVRDFEAEYESECEGCGETIWPGERAGYINDDIRASCWDCCERAQQR